MRVIALTQTGVRFVAGLMVAVTIERNYGTLVDMTESRPRPQLMTISDAAAARLRELSAQRGADSVLRIGLKKGGCAGMEYAMSWADGAAKLDEVVEDNGVRVLVDAGAVLYLLGTTMDYHEDKLSSGFVFNNPNQTSACGCGESVELAPVSQEKLREIGG